MKALRPIPEVCDRQNRLTRSDVVLRLDWDFQPLEPYSVTRSKRKAATHKQHDTVKISHRPTTTISFNKMKARRGRGNANWQVSKDQMKKMTAS